MSEGGIVEVVLGVWIKKFRDWRFLSPAEMLAMSPNKWLKCPQSEQFDKGEEVGQARQIRISLNL
jgi:hypothetical protein